ncbi:integrase, catalytic region, zinc finger, CCHC-type containing protein [Tanacetum coccineum]
MSNTNNSLQTQTSNALYNPIMKAGGKDHPPMVAPGNYNPPYKFKWTERTIPVVEGSSETTIERMAKTITSCYQKRGKAIVNSLPPTYDQEPAMVADDDEMSKEKEIDKLMALISLSFKKIYKPTNNNLRTSSNTSRENQDNTSRINRGTRYDNQRVVNVAGARENVGTHVVQQSRIQCYNCKEYRHVARECHKPKHAKDATYHKEKMLLYQKLEAHYLYMAQIQEVTSDVADNSGPIFDVEPL